MQNTYKPRQSPSLSLDATPVLYACIFTAPIMYSSDHPASTTVPPFPKIVALCGAHTPLGQTLLRDLLYSHNVDKVYAIATEEIPNLSRLPTSVLTKAIISYTAADRLDLALSRIPECDIAFCVNTTDRHAFDLLGRSTFRAVNFTIPVRFIHKMFELSVLHMSILSYASADLESRSEFCKVKAELELFVRDMRKEAADFSPLISIFRMPSLDSGAASRSSSRDRRGGRDTPHGLQVKHVSQAMQIDSFEKANKLRAISSKSKRELFEAEDIPRILRDTNYHDVM